MKTRKAVVRKATVKVEKPEAQNGGRYGWMLNFEPNHPKNPRFPVQMGVRKVKAIIEAYKAYPEVIEQFIEEHGE